MSGGNEFTEAALWRRWRDREEAAGETAAEPDALALAAYAERRLGRRGADPETDPAIAEVEAWLASQPAYFDDIRAAVTQAEAPADSRADAVLVARAQALVARAEGNLVSLSRPRRDWRHAVALSSIAASLIAAVLIGFSLGDNNVVELSGFGSTQAQEQPLIGAQGSFLATDDEESGI